MALQVSNRMQWQSDNHNILLLTELQISFIFAQEDHA